MYDCAFGQHAILMQKHVGVGELLLEPDQAALEGLPLAGVPDLAGLVQPLGNVGHQALHRAHGTIDALGQDQGEA